MPALAETRTFRRELAVTPAVDVQDDEPLPCTIATTTPVQREGFIEILDCSRAGVDLSREPLSLIIAHDSYQLAVGVVENLQALGDRVSGAVRFGTSDEAQQIRADVIAGVHRYLSVGYRLTNEGTQTDAGTVFQWQPIEVSIVPVPADPAAGFFRSLPPKIMPQATTETKTTPETRAAETRQQIIDLAAQHRVPVLGRTLARAGVSLDDAKAAILDALAERDVQAGGHFNIVPTHEGHRDERGLIVETLVQRMGGKVKGETIRDADLVGLARRSIAVAGGRVFGDTSRTQIVERAFTGTSAFPELLGNAVGRVLHDAYIEQPSAIKQVARPVTVPDFRERRVVRLSGAPDLAAVPEGDEYTTGTITDAGTGWNLTTFGRLFQLTRQAIVNDDLGGFADLVQAFGAASARREGAELAAVLLTPPQIDGSDLFSAARGTQIAHALDAAGLGAAVLALRGQKGVGGELIAQEPGALIVPAALEMTARQLVAQINATRTDDVQPFRLGVFVEPRLDAANQAAAWYLVAANQRALEYGYLDSDPGPSVITREGFEVDGMEFKCRLDFGCGWASPVGWVRSTGA